MRRFVSLIVYALVAIVLLVLAVANRGLVTLSLDPFSATDPQLSFKLPLFVLFFAPLILGVLIGGTSTWFSQARHRRAAKELRRESKRLKADLAQARQPSHHSASGKDAPSGGTALTVAR